MDEIMQEQPYAVLVRVDDEGRVTEINSSAFIQNASGWTQIDSGYSYRYHHAQNNYLPAPLMDDRRIYRWKLEDGRAVERSEEEMDADYAARSAPEMTDMELLLLAAADHEYRLCLMELGVKEDDL